MPDRESVIRFFEYVNGRDLVALEMDLDPGCVFRFPKTQDLVGPERILKFFRLLFRQFPELSFEVRNVLVEGHRAAVHWTNRGRRRSGEDYRNEGVTWMEWREGRLHPISGFFKDTDLF